MIRWTNGRIPLGRRPGLLRSLTGEGAFHSRLRGDGQLGRQSRLDQLWPYRRGSDYACFDAADSGQYA